MICLAGCRTSKSAVSQPLADSRVLLQVDLNYDTIMFGCRTGDGKAFVVLASCQHLVVIIGSRGNLDNCPLGNALVGGPPLQMTTVC